MRLRFGSLKESAWDLLSGWQVLSCSFPFCWKYTRHTQGEGKSSTLGFGWSECPFPVHGGCASPKAAQGCAPRNMTSMLATLFTNDVRATQAVVEPCCKARLLNRN